MPLIEGESLRALLKREGRLPVRDAIRITRELADALGFAHRYGIIHRDVKPGNILLTEDHARLADFGIAHLAETEGSTLTGTGLALGTPTYFSPEQAWPEGRMIVLEVNGIAVAMTPWAEHEGILKRIRVDVPEGSEGQEVTIIGYYAGSTSEDAIEFPGKKCKWCGEVEVCGTNPTCPGT